MSETMEYKVGVDIGGTHTDVFVASDQYRSTTFKVPTTPDRYSDGVVAGLEEAATSYDESLSEFLANVSLIAHGATITTNALLEGEEAKTGLLTTEGLRDTLELNMGREASLYDLQKKPVTGVVPRYLRQAVEERITSDGDVHQSLDEEQLRSQVERLRKKGASAIAVSFIFSYINSIHEKQVKEILAEYDDISAASFSSQVYPDVGFYDRTTATAVDASLKPVLRNYLDDLLDRLRTNGYDGPFRVMQGNGGVSSAEVMEEQPITSVNSSPAAVNSASAYYGTVADVEDIISFDMGGTSTDVCLIRDGNPLTTTENEVGGTPVPIPMIDINTIGAGGGSILWRDDNDVLRVGPQSAGSDPGPICYGNGGTKPTLTDANLVLGYLNPDFFLDGKELLDIEGARRGIKKCHAEPLGLSPEEVAAGAYDITNDHIINQIRQVSVARGLDPRRFTLVAAGGAGALHAAEVAKRFDTTVIVPKSAGAFSAAGVLLSDIKHTFVRAISETVSSDPSRKINEAVDNMKQEAKRTLAQEDMPQSRWQFGYELSTSYVKQAHDITISIPKQIDDVETIADSHHSKHEDIHAFKDEKADIRVINARLVATATTEGDLHLDSRSGVAPEDARKGQREVYYKGLEERVTTPIYSGERKITDTIDGPCIIEDPHTTIVVPPGQLVRTDDVGNYYIESL